MVGSNSPVFFRFFWVFMVENRPFQNPSCFESKAMQRIYRKQLMQTMENPLIYERIDDR